MGLTSSGTNKLLLVIAALLLVCALSATVAGDPQIVIRTALGTESTGTAASLTCASTDKNLGLMASAVQRGRWDHWDDSEPTNGFILRCAKDTYLVIRPDALRTAELKAGKHSVTLANGQQWQGTLIGELTLVDAEGRKRVYDMSKVVAVTGAKTATDTANSEPIESAAKPQAWSLTTSTPAPKTYAVVNPLFGYQYTESYRQSIDALRYIDKSRPAADKTGQFYLKIGKDETLANLDDFRSMSIKANVKAKTFDMTVTAQSGQATTGTLALKHKASANSPEPAELPWFLTAEIADEQAVLVVRLGDGALELKKATPASSVL